MHSASTFRGPPITRFLLFLFLSCCIVYLPAAAANTPATTAPTTQAHVPIIRLTPAAAKEILAILKTQNLKNPSLRVGVKQEGTKFSYILDITEDKPAPDDTQLPEQGITVLVNPKGVISLAGTVTDFQDTPAARGFVFHNPNTLPD